MNWILTVWDVADHSWKLFLTLGCLPETISVQIHTGSFGGFRGPAAELIVAVVCPVVVLPSLDKKYIQKIIVLNRDGQDIKLLQCVINQFCSFERSIHQRILEKCIMVCTKIMSSTNVFNIDKNNTVYFTCTSIDQIKAILPKCNILYFYFAVNLKITGTILFCLTR